MEKEYKEVTINKPILALQFTGKTKRFIGFLKANGIDGDKIHIENQNGSAIVYYYHSNGSRLIFCKGYWAVFLPTISFRLRDRLLNLSDKEFQDEFSLIEIPEVIETPELINVQN